MSQEIVRILKVDTKNSDKTVKDLKDEIKGLSKELDKAVVGSEEFNSTLKKLTITQKQYNEIQQQIRDMSKTNQQDMVRFASFARNLAKSYSALNAAVGLFANGNEDVQKAMLKVQRTIQLIQGLDGIAGLVRDIPKIGAAIKRWFDYLSPVERSINNIAKGINGIDPATVKAMNEASAGAGSKIVETASSDVVNQIKIETGALQQQANTIVPVNDQWDKYNKELVEAKETMKEWNPEMARLSDIFEEYNKHTDQAKVDIKALGNNINELMKGDPSKLHNFLKELTLDEDALNATAKEFGWTTDSLIEGLKNLEEGLGEDSEAIKKIKAELEAAENAAGKAVTGFKKLGNTLKAVFSTVGWTLVITALVTAALKLLDYIKNLKTATEEQRAFNKEISQTTNQIGSKQIVVLKELANAYAKVGDSAKAKEQFLKDYSEKIKETGIAINDVKTAEDALVNNTDKYVKALMDRAKAQAIEQQAIKVYQDYLNERYDLEQQLAAAGKRVMQGVSPDYGKPMGAGMNTAYDELLNRKNFDIILGRITKLDEETEKRLKNMFDNVAALQTAYEGLFTTTTTTTKPDNGTKKVESELKSLIEIYENALNVLNESKDNEYDEIVRRYAEQIKLAEKYGKDITALEMARDKELADLQKKWDDEYLKELENRTNEEYETLQKQIERIRRMNDTSNLKEPREQRYQTVYSQPVATSILGLGSNWKNVYQSGADVKAQYEAQVAYNNQIYDLTKSRIEQENELLNKQLEIEGLTADKRMEIERTIAENKIALSDAALAKEDANLQASLEMQEKRRQALNATLDVASNLTGAMASMFRTESQNEKKSEKERASALKAYKTFAVAQAIMDTYKGANEAYTAMASIPYVGPALGIAAAAAAIAGGIANVKQILSESISGSNGYSSSASVEAPVMTTAPIEYTRNVLTDKELDEMNKPIKCYVLESDIRTVSNRVQVTEDNSTF